MPLIVLCYVLEALRSVMLTGILVRRVTHYLVPIAAIVAFTNLILNYTLISRFLAMGAAVATLISYAVLLALTYGSPSGFIFFTTNTGATLPLWDPPCCSIW